MFNRIKVTKKVCFFNYNTIKPETQIKRLEPHIDFKNEKKKKTFLQIKLLSNPLLI